MFTVLVFTDGRNDYLEQTLSSFVSHVSFPDKPYKILVDDMPAGRDVAFLERFADRLGFDEVILNDTNLGSFGSIMKAWSALPDGTEHIFHLENDFTFPGTVDVVELAAVLEEPWIVNITLLRQPWYEDERDAGGVIKLHPERFRDADIRGVPVCLHQHYFGHNPGLYKRAFARVIPDTSRSVPGRVLSHELVYRDLLLAEDPSRHFAIYGRSTDAPRVIHIGVRRVGHSPDHRPLIEDEFEILESEERSLRRAAAALEREIAVLRPAIEERQRALATCRLAAKADRVALQEAEREIDALRSSKSWKITAPLRRVLDALNWVRR
jgi:hypothetical protein